MYFNCYPLEQCVVIKLDLNILLRLLNLSVFCTISICSQKAIIKSKKKKKISAVFVKITLDTEFAIIKCVFIKYY